MRFLTDHTSEELARLAPRLAAKLPVTDPLLAELLRISALVLQRQESEDPTTLLQDVQAIELVASRFPVPVAWQKLLTDYVSGGRVRQQVSLAVHNAVWVLAGAYDLRDRVTGLPSPNELRTYLPGESDRYELRIDVAVTALQALAVQIPAHHEAGRRFRTIARRCADTKQLARWVDSEVAIYNQRVNRLKRCRDALIHGGPVSMEVAATVQHFANGQAQAVVATALEAVLEGQPLNVMCGNIRDRYADWRSEIPAQQSALSALTGHEPPA
jgi:hypothetical protein